MQIETLQEQYKDKSFSPSNNRHYIGLSENAWGILRKDFDAFLQPSGTKLNAMAGDEAAEYEVPDDLSQLVNVIFLNFWETAAASVDHYLKAKRINLEKSFGELDSQTREKVVNVMIEKHHKNVQERAKKRNETLKHKKGKACKTTIALYKESIKVLTGAAAEEISSHYGGNISLYLKAILEEYCELPYLEREKIFYRDFIREVELIAKSNEPSKSNANALELEWRKNAEKPKFCVPCGVASNPENTYNYLYGYDSEKKQISHRLTSFALSGAKPPRVQYTLTTAEFPLTEDDVKQIHAAAHEKGVQYITDNGELHTVKVRLTDKGRELYHYSIFSQRPMYERIKRSGDCYIYYFKCTDEQAYNYFFRFEKNATIIEPEDLRERFKNRYVEAAQNYE